MLIRCCLSFTQHIPAWEFKAARHRRNEKESVAKHTQTCKSRVRRLEIPEKLIKHLTIRTNQQSSGVIELGEKGEE